MPSQRYLHLYFFQVTVCTVKCNRTINDSFNTKDWNKRANSANIQPHLMREFANCTSGQNETCWARLCTFTAKQCTRPPIWVFITGNKKILRWTVETQVTMKYDCLFCLWSVKIILETRTCIINTTFPSFSLRKRKLTGGPQRTRRLEAYKKLKIAKWTAS